MVNFLNQTRWSREYIKYRFLIETLNCKAMHLDSLFDNGTSADAEYVRVMKLVKELIDKSVIEFEKGELESSAITIRLANAEIKKAIHIVDDKLDRS